MPAREPNYRRTAANAFEELDAEDQEEIDRIVDGICDDPYTDPPLKTVYLMPPAVLTLYSDDHFWILYHLPDDETVDIWNLGKDEPPDTVGRGPSTWQA